MSNPKRVLVGSAAFILSVAIFIFIFGDNEASLPHLNTIDTKISQYSDTQITPSAREANPEFKNIAFADLPVEANRSFFSNQIAAVARAIRLFVNNPSKDATKEYGSWVWTPIMSLTPEYVESVLSDAKADGVNVIYLSIDTYLDIFTMEKGEQREINKEIYSDKLEDFISRADSKGISVDAESGWRNWAEDENIYKAFALINYVKNFNASRQSKFRGFQYDVEPYLLDSYEKNKVSVLRNFVELIDKTQSFIGDSNLKFSVVVPDFYDEKDNMTPKFSYNGKKEYVFKHLLNILDKREDSSIIVMSYRNFADSDDGTIGISRNEMRTADRGSYSTKIIIAQETSEVSPSYLTFHNTSKSYFLTQIDKINAAFNRYSNFGGIAVHYANSFLALK